MKCRNCSTEILDTAKFCSHCEAPVGARLDVQVDEEVVLEVLEQIPPEAVEGLRELARNSPTARQFVDRTLTGPCPRCNSIDTEDCEEDPEIEDICVGRCFDCGHLWCLECAEELDRTLGFCPCTSDDDENEA